MILIGVLYNFLISGLLMAPFILNTILKMLDYPLLEKYVSENILKLILPKREVTLASTLSTHYNELVNKHRKNRNKPILKVKI